MNRVRPLAGIVRRGRWRGLVAAAFAAGLDSCSGPASVTGAWLGRLDDASKDPVVGLRLSSDLHDNVVSSLTLLDRGSLTISAVVEVASHSLRVSSKEHGVTFAGVLADRSHLRGTFTRDGRSSMVTFSRVVRPQESEGPVLYDTLRVNFESVPGVRLAGTLALPSGTGPFPVVVLVSGSGPHDRDGSMFLHRPFKIVADYLARRGIASLRYDDRGTAQSTGVFEEATTADFATDAEAAVRFVAHHPKLAANRIGLVGHSEGGLIAPLVASRSRDVAFVVLLAAPALKFDSLALLQSRAMLMANGASAAMIDSAAQKSRAAYRTMLSSSESPWYRFWMRYDPAPALERLRVPTLSLYASKDVQVPAAENIGAMRALLQIAGNADVEVRTLPQLNHLFQHATTGLMSEYPLIEETFAPEALSAIGDWITTRFSQH